MSDIHPFLYSLGSVGPVLPLWLYVWVAFIRRETILYHLKHEYGSYAARQHTSEFDLLVTVNAVVGASIGLIVGSVITVLFADGHAALFLFVLYGLATLTLAMQAGHRIEARIRPTV